MKGSIKQKLTNYIRSRKTPVTYSEIVWMSNNIGCKVDTATRKLRNSCAPEVEKIRNSRGVITAYKIRDDKKDNKKKV